MLKSEKRELKRKKATKRMASLADQVKRRRPRLKSHAIKIIKKA